MIALVLALLMLGPGQATADEALVDISRGWLFKTDEDGKGLQKGWQRAEFDDSFWAPADLDVPWEQHGAPGYDGIGWYRKKVSVPEGWARVFLALGGISERADVYIDGTLMARGLERPHRGTLQVVREIDRRLFPGDELRVAIRVTNETKGSPGGFGCAGGVPAMLVRDARQLFVDRVSWLDYLAQEHPALPWPGWARGRGAAWLPVRDLAGGPGCLMGMGGEVQPEGAGFAISAWLYHRDAGRFYSLDSPGNRVTLENGYLPLPLYQANAGKYFRVYVRTWVDEFPESEGRRLGIGQVTVENTLDRTRELDLALAIHPFGVNAPPHAIRHIKYDPDTQLVFVNGRAVAVLAGPPDLFGATAFSDSGGMVARLLARGELEESHEAFDEEEQLASGAAIYRLKIQPFGARTQTFRIFLDADPDGISADLALKARRLPWGTSWKGVRAAWDKAISSRGKLVIRLTESSVKNAFYASLAYVRMGMRDPERSEAERRLGVAALLRAGHLDTVAAAGYDPKELWKAPGAYDPLRSTAGEPICDHVGRSPGLGFYWPGEAFREAWLRVREGDSGAAAAAMDRWLDRQTMPGTYAWAEAVDPETERYGYGEIPNFRAAAYFVCTVRDMLLRESEGFLDLASNLPATWLAPGRRVLVRYAPTSFGVVPGFSLTSSQRGIELRMYSLTQIARLERKGVIAGLEPARPPAGYRWKIPGERAVSRAFVDGKALSEVPPDRYIRLPADFKRASVVW